MSNSNDKKYEQSLNVASILGGLTLTALTILTTTNISEYNHKFIGIAEFKQMLIIGFGVVGSLFIASVIGLNGVVVNPVYKNKLYANVTFGFYEAGFVGLLILFPLLIMPFNFPAAIIIIIIEGVWGSLAAINRIRNKGKKTIKTMDDFLDRFKDSD